jgi:hypothetical protein
MSISKKPLWIGLVLAAGWILWVSINGIGWAFKAQGNIPYIIRYEATECITGFIFTALLFCIYSLLQKRIGFWLFALAAPLCLIAASGWHIVSNYTMWRIGLTKGFQTDLKGVLIAGGLMDGIVLGLFSSLYFAVDHWLKFREEKEKAQQATALAHQAQLQMLRYQLNPHFLFNALNSIRAMIAEDQTRARQMVTELADFLRYSLDGKEQESTIGDEIQAIENYMAIQRIRFEERLDVTMRIDPKARKITVPCFLIHPLVENAVKYGMQTSTMPLGIEIEVALHEQQLEIRVSNTGRLINGEEDNLIVTTHQGTGTGLKNIAQRLNLVFPSRNSFRVYEEAGQVHAEIKLQLEAEEMHDEDTQSPDR